MKIHFSIARVYAISGFAIAGVHCICSELKILVLEIFVLLYIFIRK